MATVLVDLDLIDVDPRNPRGKDVGDVSDLKQALLECGQQDPMHLIPRDGRYLMHEGHRRLKALRELGRRKGKAIERHFPDDLSRLLSQGQMHLHRKDFNPMSWARYCHRLYFEHNQTREQIARRLGVSQAWVRDHIALNHLADWEKAALERGDLTKKEALHRLARRRAARDGTLTPAVKKTTTAKKSVGEPHLNADHDLAEQVAVRCASGGLEHAARPKIGGVGCGVCWENVIRADAITAVSHPVLTAVA